MKHNVSLARLLRKPGIYIPLAVFSCFLWGSAFPAVKQGYLSFQVNTENTSSILLFAGLRFTLAGILTLLILAFADKESLKMKKEELRFYLKLALLQTAIQYTFFYVGLSRTAGVTSSILSSTGGFFSVLIAPLAFRDDKLDARKISACLLGLLGVILLNIGKGSRFTFAWDGEGFVLISSLLGAFGAMVSKQGTGRFHPFAISGYQLFFGGLVLTLIGLLTGGRVAASSPLSFLLLLYLALISTLAFSIWTFLLKVHDLSKISIFKALIPVFGSLLSVLILKEGFSLQSFLALLLILFGISLLNLRKTPKNA